MLKLIVDTNLWISFLLSKKYTLDSDANYLLTGDNDLLILKSFGTTEIITLAEFKTKRGII